MLPHVWNRELRAYNRKELGPLGTGLWAEDGFDNRIYRDVGKGLTEKEQKKLDRRNARRE